jgi:HK97 gp10 family phage protein
MKGLERVILRAEMAQRDLKLEISIAQVEEMNQAIIMARSLVPYATGFLQSQIGVQNAGEMEITGGVVGVPYCRYVEFGTRYMNARPYWRPPVWEAWFRLRRRTKEIIQKLLNVD